MLILYFILLCCSTLAYVQSADKPEYSLRDANRLFEDFIATYNKQYHNRAEKNIRFRIFKQNLMEINRLNADPQYQDVTFDINKFTDLTKEEVVKIYTGLKTDFANYNSSGNMSIPDDVELTENFDWREKNAVTPVKNQDKCGSCWAFSTTGTIEGAYAMKHKQLLAFSEQQLVDCDKSNHGCYGGWMYKALEYLKRTGGIEGAEDYPYTAKEGQCLFSASKVKAKIIGQKAIDLSNEKSAQKALVQFGPIAIAVHVSNEFLNYANGVLDCPTGRITHAVLLVGYGTEEGKPYWLIKNSWGMWGDKGYIKVARTANPCGFAEVLGTVAEVA